MAAIPSALGVYEDMDGDLWIRFGDGKNYWVHLTKWYPNPGDEDWLSEFVLDEEVAEHLPLKCVSNEKAKEER